MLIIAPHERPRFQMRGRFPFVGGLPIDKTCQHCSAPFVDASRGERMKFCTPKCRHTHWAANNRERLNETVRRYRARRYQVDGCWRDDSPKSAAAKAWMIEIKSKPCMDCGGSFEVCCMDFDHREGTTKEHNIGSMFAHHYGMELIQAELEKCDLVCANCHRIRTRNRRTNNGRDKLNIRAVSEDREIEPGVCDLGKN